MGQFGARGHGGGSGLGSGRAAGFSASSASSASQASSRVCLADQLGGDQRAPGLAVHGGQVAHRGEVRQLLAHGTSAGGEHGGPFGGIKKRELAETGQELRLVSRLLRGEVGEHAVQQFVAHLGQRVHQAGRPALRLRGLGHRARLLEPFEGRVQRVVVQHDAGRLLHAFAQLVPVRGAGPQPPQDQDLDVRHIVQYDLCQTGRRGPVAPRPGQSPLRECSWGAMPEKLATVSGAGFRCRARIAASSTVS